MASRSTGRFVILALVTAGAGAFSGYLLGRTSERARPAGDALERSEPGNSRANPAGEATLSLSPNDSRENRLAAMLSAEGNPREVLVFLRGIADSNFAAAYREVCESLFQSWVANDPDAAVEAADRLEDPTFRKAAIQGALSGMFANDPQRAMQQLVDWQFDVPWEFPVPDWLKENPDQGCALLSQLRGSSASYRLRWSLPALWAEKDPAATMEWARRQAGSIGRQIRESVMMAWAKHDPEGAMRASDAGAYEDAEIRDGLVLAIANAKGETDPASALDWAFERLDHRKQRSAIVKILRTWAEDDLASAVEWTMAQPNIEAQRTAFGVLAEEWAKTDVVSAAEFALSSDSRLVSEWRFLPMIGEAYLEKDPLAALDWSERLRADMRPRAQSSVLEGLLQKDQTVAASEVTKRLDRISASALENFSYRFFQKDPEAAARWMQSLPSGTDMEEIRKGLRTAARKQPSEKMQALVEELGGKP